MTKARPTDPEALRETLQRAGLSEQQAAVYLALLEVGSCSAGPLVTRSGLHRERVYRALEVLEERGLVVRSSRNNRQRFHAEHPEVLLRQQAAQVRALQAALPYLTALMPDGGHGLQVRIFSGSDEYVESLLAAAESAAGYDRRVRIIGASSGTDIFLAVGKRYTEYLRACKRLQVRKQLLLPTRPPDAANFRFALDSTTKIRILKDGVSAPCATRVAGDLVSFEIFGAEPTVLQVFNRPFARSYEEYFLRLWRQAERYAPAAEASAGVDTE